MADLYDYDLGEYRRTVSTAPRAHSPGSTAGWSGRTPSTTRRPSPASRRRSAADPDCAMAHWGIAYALGPNYNKPWEFFDDDDLATDRRPHPRRRRTGPWQARWTVPPRSSRR